MPTRSTGGLPVHGPAMGGNGEWFYRGQLHAAIGRAANALAPRTVADRLDAHPDRDRGEGETR